VARRLVHPALEQDCCQPLEGQLLWVMGVKWDGQGQFNKILVKNI
jgi:hypothetical protein